MNIIDTIKEFETVGFTRKQAEQQVKTMVDLKQGLATEKDLKALDSKFEVKLSALETKFDVMMKSVDLRFDAQDKYIAAIPFKTAMYVAGTAITIIGLLKFVAPFIK